MFTNTRRNLESRRSAWFRALPVVAACALAVSGCGGSGPSAGGEGIPGTKEFGLTDKEFGEHIEKTQALIADCMAEAGFEYVPVDAKTIEAAQKRVREEPGYTHETFKAKWGFAVSTRFDNPPRDIGLGPNLQIHDNLPPAQQDAYYQTLFGDDWHADFVFTLDEEDFSPSGGCTRKAVAQVFTPGQLDGTFVNPKDVLVEEDPRIIKAKRQWSQCMHDAGYEYEEDQDEIIEEYEERLEEVLDGDDPTTLTAGRAAALKKLQDEEIAVSLADYKCDITYTQTMVRKVEFEIFGERVSG